MDIGILILDRLQRCILSDPFSLARFNAAQTQIALTVCLCPFGPLVGHPMANPPIRHPAHSQIHNSAMASRTVIT